MSMGCSCKKGAVRGAAQIPFGICYSTQKNEEPQNIASLYFGSIRKKATKNASIFMLAILHSWSRKSDLNR